MAANPPKTQRIAGIIPARLASTRLPRKVLRERKSEETYQEWLRQLRDQAYVELRLEER